MKHDHESHDHGQYLEQRCRKTDDRIGRLVPASLDDLRNGIDHMDGQPRQADDSHRCGHEIPKQLGDQRKDAPAQEEYDDGRKEEPERIFPPFQLQHERIVKAAAKLAADEDGQQRREQPSPQERHGKHQDGHEPAVYRMAGHPGFHEDRRQLFFDSGDVNLLKHLGNELEGFRGEEPDRRVVFLLDAVEQELVFPSFCLDATDDLTMDGKAVLKVSFGVCTQSDGGRQHCLVEDAGQAEGKLMGALSGLPCVEIVDGPLIVLALHRLEEAPDRPLRGASAQGIVIGDLVLRGRLRQRIKRRFFSRRGSRCKAQQRHQRPSKPDGVYSEHGHGSHPSHACRRH